MQNKYLAVDLEISTPIPPSAKEWRDYRPFGVACVVTKGSDHTYPLLWTSQLKGDFAQRMFENDLFNLRKYLQIMQSKGYILLSFNGCGFDFDVLNEECPSDDWKHLALSHVDLFFHIFCVKGYSKGLDRIAQYYKMGKPEGVNGAKAPQMWLDGQYHQVLDYCANDVQLTLDLAAHAEINGMLQWLSNKGDVDTVWFNDGLLTVEQALKLPEPDNAWMGDKAWSRSKFTGWMNG